MDAFHGLRDINSNYVDGMYITYGSPRKHIWTYAVGLSDDNNYNGNYNCPCAKYPGPAPPSFVGDHYYCESGNTGKHEYTFYNDTLWEQINAPCTLGVTKDSPARSCYQIHQCNPKAPSQSYWLEMEVGLKRDRLQLLDQFTVTWTVGTVALKVGQELHTST